jgi:hypothetical protein
MGRSGRRYAMRGCAHHLFSRHQQRHVGTPLLLAARPMWSPWATSWRHRSPKAPRAPTGSGNEELRTTSGGKCADIRDRKNRSVRSIDVDGLNTPLARNSNAIRGARHHSDRPPPIDEQFDMPRVVRLFIKPWGRGREKRRPSTRRRGVATACRYQAGP